MSETNPPPSTTPPVEPAPNPQQPPAATPPPAAPPRTPEPSGTPDMAGLMTRLETVLTGLPERTANAVREVSPQHVANPTQPQQPPQGQQQTPPPGENPAGNARGGPSKLAKWFHGIK
jgi:hypothetical protein